MQSSSEYSEYSYSDDDSKYMKCFEMVIHSVSWIEHFCSKKENSYMCMVDEDWIRDSFNLYGLDNDCPLYKPALNLILDSSESSSDSSSGNLSCGEWSFVEEYDSSELEDTAVYLYGMIHARYIITIDGMEAMVTLFLFL